MNSHVAPELIGVWQRESLAINSREPFEDSRVVWLQTPSRYADLRVSIDPGKATSQACAGTQKWQNSVLTFHHDLDLSGSYPEDIGHISWQGETMIEQGNVKINNENIHFRERWRRCSSAKPDYQTLENREPNGQLLGIAICVAEHSLIINHTRDFGAGYFKFTNSCWQRQWATGHDVTHLLPLFSNRKPIDARHTPWQLIERR